MTNRTRILWASLWTVLLSLALPALAEQSSHPISDSTAILFTNDIHCYYERDIGYDGLMLYRKENIAVPDADGREIPLVQTGSYFDHVGVMILDADGSIHADLVSGIPAPEAWMEGIEAIEITRGNRSRWVDKAMHEFLEDITEAYAPTMNRRIGESPCELALTAADGAASSKSHENGMCELVADAYRAIAGTDISIINAGSVRNGLPAGEITFNSVLNVMPYSNDIWIARLSGQTILFERHHSDNLSPGEQDS